MNLWQLTHSDASLKAGPLQAKVDVLNPALGLHDLTWNSVPIAGNLFGVSIAAGAIAVAMPVEGIDRYVRGNDLVANYPECQSQQFTLHVYWRVVANSAQQIVMDSIVSLQTSLLECFPKAVLTTNLPGGQVLAFSTETAPASEIGEYLSSDQSTGVLVRGADPHWSYFEATHPTDLGCWRVSRADGIQVQRELGGEFQEKGVIRRLRVRGAFLARKHDERVARELFAAFAESEPPLTA